MNPKDDVMLCATSQLNEEAEDIFLPIRTSEYRALVELATTHKLEREQAERDYWNALSEIRALKVKLAKYEGKEDA